MSGCVCGRGGSYTTWLNHFAHMTHSCVIRQKACALCLLMPPSVTHTGLPERVCVHVCPSHRSFFAENLLQNWQNTLRTHAIKRMTIRLTYKKKRVGGGYREVCVPVSVSSLLLIHIYLNNLTLTDNFNAINRNLGCIVFGDRPKRKVEVSQPVALIF